VIRNQAVGATPQGEQIDRYTLTNSHGVEVCVINYGGNITSLSVPDRKGKPANIVLAFDSLEEYFVNSPSFGAIIGRYAGRIAKGKFTLDGIEYSLPINNGPNAIHGGIQGFSKVLWHAEPFKNAEGEGVVFTYLSKDGEEGYPGNLSARVTYTLTDQNELIFDYQATTDKATPLNFTQHTYFNLAGDGAGDVLRHELMLNASQFTPLRDGLIPTGEIRSVQGTPLDFTRMTPIGARIYDTYEQLTLARGYDQNFVINRNGGGLELAARVYEPASGRILEVFTTEPAVQFYTANFLDGTITRKQGYAYQQRSGFCLETQHFPDSPNHPNFPSTILRPGETFCSQTICKFSIRK
jgi:aldose 1-epimerase